MRWSGTRVALIAAALSIVGIQSAGAVPSDPPGNVVANPSYASICAHGPGVIDNTQTCIAATLQAIDNARAQEGVVPMVLPSHFASLFPDQQLLVVIDRERVDRGLPPFAGLVPELDAAAQEGADNSRDPKVAAPSYAGNAWTGTSDWAASQPNALGADYFWMYLDGWGGTQATTPNFDCTGPSGGGCWSHRNGLLGSFNSLPNLSMGGALNASASDGRQAWTALVLGTGSPPPGYTYTWAAALADTPSGPSSTCGSAPAPTGAVSRIAGENRDLTAVSVSARSFPNGGSTNAVVLASDANFPDALAGGPLAVAKGGPLLITPPSGLSHDVESEITRVLPAHDTVYVLGGTFALSSAIDDALTNDGYQVTRIAGASRYETAAKIADALGDPVNVFEATGNDFPDALGAGPAAVLNSAAILLTNGSHQSSATAAYLSAHPGKHYAIGGPASAADPSATSISGADRYDTALKVTSMFFPSPPALGFATGAGFPDTLAGGPAVASAHGALLLVPKCPPLPNGVAGYLQAAAPSVKSASLFGGTFVVSDDTLAQVDQALAPAS